MTEWQPIETGPKDGTRVLLYFPKEKDLIYIGFFVHTEEYRYGKAVLIVKEWRAENFLFDITQPLNPTHWAPLPAGPVGFV